MAVIIVLAAVSAVALVATIRALRVDGLRRVPACAERLARYQ